MGLKGAKAGMQGVEAARAKMGACSADGGFKAYGPIDESYSGKAKIQPDQKVEAMRVALQKTINFFNSLQIPHFETIAMGPRRLNALHYPFICDLRYGKRDIQKFLLSIKGAGDFNNWHGTFVNALVGMRAMERHELDFRHQDGLAHGVGGGSSGFLRILGDVGFECGAGMEDGLVIAEGSVGEDAGGKMRGGTLWIRGPHAKDRLGFGAQGVIILEGDAAGSAGFNLDGALMVLKKSAKGFLGHDMGRGYIIVFGSVGESAGCGMSGGFIRIAGDTGAAVGEHMRGGTIIVEGNTGPELGWKMQGGEIHVNGEIGGIAKIINGRVFQKGKLIVDVK